MDSGKKKKKDFKVILCNLKDLQLIENNLMCPIQPLIWEFLWLFIFSYVFLVNEKR